MNSLHMASFRIMCVPPVIFFKCLACNPSNSLATRRSGRRDNLEDGIPREGPTLFKKVI